MLWFLLAHHTRLPQVPVPLFTAGIFMLLFIDPPEMILLPISFPGGSSIKKKILKQKEMLKTTNTHSRGNESSNDKMLLDLLNHLVCSFAPCHETDLKAKIATSKQPYSLVQRRPRCLDHSVPAKVTSSRIQRPKGDAEERGVVEKQNLSQTTLQKRLVWQLMVKRCILL